MRSDLDPFNPAELPQIVQQQDWRLHALDEWRKELDRRVAVLESDVNTEKANQQLRGALAAQGRLRLTRLQQLVVSLAGAIAVADFVRSFFG